jgi:hypothetical protein
MTAEQFELVFFFVVGSGFIPLILYLIRFKSVPREIHFIAICVAISTLSDFICYQMAIRKIHNMLVTNNYYLLEFTLLACFFYHILFKRMYKKFFIAAILAFIVAFLLISFFIQPYLTVHQNFVWSLNKLICLIFSLMFIHEWAMSGREGKQYRAHLWIIAGLVFHYGFALYIIAMHHQLSIMDIKTSRLIWSFHNLSYMVKHLLFAVGFYVIPGRIVLPEIKKNHALQSNLISQAGLIENVDTSGHGIT